MGEGLYDRMIAAGVIMKSEVLTNPVDVFQFILNSSSFSSASSWDAGRQSRPCAV
jgi:hypothetical protein